MILAQQQTCSIAKLLFNDQSIMLQNINIRSYSQYKNGNGQNFNVTETFLNITEY